MKCSNCGYIDSCPCEFENGLCLTCHYGAPRINRYVKPKGDNYCNQTLENLEYIKKGLQSKERTKLTATQISIINSQIKMFDDKPCKFKKIIDNILLN